MFRAISRAGSAGMTTVALGVALSSQAPPSPPVAKTEPKTTTLHGETLVDNYSWMREKGSPAVAAYLEAENAYTAARMKHTEALQETLYKEILGRIKETDAAVPYFQGGYWNYTRTEQGKDYPIYCRKKGSLDAPEEIVLDQNALAAGKKFHALGGFDVSPDGMKLLYLEDLTAFREYTLYVKDLSTGKILESIPKVWNGTAWADDNKTFFYMTADEAKRGNAVWRHMIGTARDQDVKVFQEDNVLHDVSVFRSRSGKFVFIPADGYTSSEWRVIPTASPTTAPRVVVARRPNVEYSVEHGGGFFYILTNDRAKNFRIVRTSDADGSLANWQGWVPHRADAFVEGVDVFEKFAVVAERRDGLRRLRVIELASDLSHDVTFPEAAYGVFPGNNPEFASSLYRFSYSSFVTPPSTFDYNLATRQRELKKRQEIPSGFEPTNYEVQRRMAPARDGVQVPVSILLRKGTRLDGTSPLLLYAYGSYGATTEPTFSSSVFSLVDRGMVYAIAHIRGGQEMGRQWYDDGKMMKKKNTFNDFIDVAEFLVKNSYTRPDRLVANGGSAGGLLMGVVANMRPDLFKAIVAEVPFVDVINTMLDSSLPLTAQEWEQWGNPKNPEQYAYLRSYSPYDNLEKKAYPWILVTTSVNDSQVMYWEPAKWVAKLRATKTDSNPLYFKINLAGGHGGSSGRYERFKEIAFKYAFMLDAVGLAQAPAPTAQ
ncbi:MAG TPA: S9 family peptidase [Vicinamibacterales bacterium]|jgi:oligopeptidase B|nr:S9 family peptidase [Vicinamibacterales bacterium]